MMKPIRVVVCKPGKAPRVARIEGDDADEIQSLVGGGYFEAHRLNGRVSLLCNEDGVDLKLPANRLVPGLGVILGTFVLSATDRDGEQLSLDADEEVYWLDQAKTWPKGAIMKKEFTQVTCRKWMRAHRSEYVDECGEVNSTALAEGAAAHFDVNQVKGPLDDETHWIWELAVLAVTS